LARLLWRPEAVPEASSLRESLTKDLCRLVLWLIAGHGIGYYVLYRDGGKSHPLFVGLGAGKLAGAALAASWYAQGHATAMALPVAVVPEIGFGLYMLKVWWDMPRAAGNSRGAPSAGAPAANKTSPSLAPKDWVLGFAAAHAFLLAFPVFLLSVTEVRAAQ
jgi:hypothetical protein